MTDDWTPENLPILLMNRPLLTSTRTKPIRIGNARMTEQDEDSLLALDKLVDEKPGAFAPSRYIADADWLSELTGLGYQVSYYFPSSARPNGHGPSKYGADGITYRVLYEALCDGFNAGERFIEAYFLSAFKDRMKSRYDEAVKALKQALADEAQRRRAGHVAYLSNYKAWSTPMVKKTFTMLAQETKRDIENDLATGRIPLKKNGLSERTMAARRRAGISSDTVFYGTGRLVRSLVISVILLDNETVAQTEGL